MQKRAQCLWEASTGDHFEQTAHPGQLKKSGRGHLTYQGGGVNIFLRDSLRSPVNPWKTASEKFWCHNITRKGAWKWAQHNGLDSG